MARGRPLAERLRGDAPTGPVRLEDRDGELAVPPTRGGRPGPRLESPLASADLPVRRCGASPKDKIVPATIARIARDEARSGLEVGCGEGGDRQGDRRMSYVGDFAGAVARQAPGKGSDVADSLVGDDEPWARRAGAYRRRGGPT